MGRGRKGRRHPRWEQTYGRFHCKKCNKRWESSHVYNIWGTLKVAFRQKCRECQTAIFPWRTDPIVCQQCQCAPCECPEDDRNRQRVDPKKRHRSDLCMKCLNGYPCYRNYADDHSDEDYD